MIFEKINKSDKTLVRLIKEKREDSSWHNWKRKKEHCYQPSRCKKACKGIPCHLYAKKSDNSDEMDKCLERYKIQKLTEEEKVWIRPVTKRLN